MQKKNENAEIPYCSRYSVDIIKMIRNNNIATGKDSLSGYDTYFMLDYFDLLFHQTLTGESKLYREFWNIRDSYEKKTLNYKAAYKTLSLYAGQNAGNEDIFKTQDCHGEKCISDAPFLGIIQINIVYNIFTKELDVEDTLSACENKIMEHLLNNDLEKHPKTSCKMFRSSTSGDLCFVVKSASIEHIYKISALINHLVIHYNGDSFKLNTYTNIGIECCLNDKGQFMTLRDDTIDLNRNCEFALRITSDHEFAKVMIGEIQKANTQAIVVKPMEGLFGRYDFLLQMPMCSFAQIYTTLCASKITGGKTKSADSANKKSAPWIQYLISGITDNKVQIINERVLVPLSETLFMPRELKDVPESAYQNLQNTEDKLRSAVKKIGNTLKNNLNRFQAMEGIFIEERRVFIDIGRELSELISTYVPQGIENDSHVNWQMLISDLKVTFMCIDKWAAAYEMCSDDAERKDMRIHFLDDLRLVTDAINRYYKFLQNVNAQTWQSPLYEIQTQLDAEKMMIAYREFLYEYFFDYKEHYKADKEPRPMLYPILYPDMAIDIACAMAVFQNIRGLDSRLLICRVPSFEYYGRMFDMIPWILHEASHSVRTLDRPARNNYLIYTVMHNVFDQLLYKFFNKYSNDFGYHKLGALENDILAGIADTAVKEFEAFCRTGKDDPAGLEINYLETKLLEYLEKIFDQNIVQSDKGEDAVNIRSIQTTLLHFLGVMGLLYGVDNDAADTLVLVEQSAESADALCSLLKLIHDSYYEQITGSAPAPMKWQFIIKDITEFEVILENDQKLLRKFGIKKDILRDYCFTMRELNRLQGAWSKRRKDDANDALRNSLWEKCIPDIRRKIKKGFEENKGFTELYRILNMVFNSEESSDHTNTAKIGQIFNILLQEEVHTLVTREVTIYRESYADLYMAAALDFSAFGYCRQISQTTSDASKENPMQWASAVNVNRFRAVSAILSAKECTAIESGSNIKVPMDALLKNGKAYCHATLECITKSIFHKTGAAAPRNNKKEKIEAFFTALRQNIDTIFTYFTQDELVEEALEDSLLSVYLEPDAHIDEEPTYVSAARREAVKIFKEIERELREYRHVVYRIKCFIQLIDLTGENGQIVIPKKEFEHLKALYEEHLLNCRILKDDEACKNIADYYNNPQSALDKTPEIMLEDTIHFIQTYYYRNRFKIMSSDEIKGELDE